MPSERDRIRMDADELRVLYDEVRTVAIGTVGSDGAPHLSAMWFAMVDGSISFWTYTKAQKTVNLRRDPRVSALFEAGETYEELRGALVTGTARLLDTPAEALRIGVAVARRYNPDLDPISARAIAQRQVAKRTGVQIDVTRVASWDHRKLR